MTRRISAFEQFSDYLGEVADDWRADATKLNAEPGARQAFDEMATKALREVVAKNSSELGKFNRVFAEHGMSLIARYHFLIAAKTALEGGDVKRYEEVARHKDTCKQLLEIATCDNEDAGQLEEVAGLDRNPRIDIADLLEQGCSISDEGRFRLFALEDARASWLRYASEAGGCPMNMSQNLLPVYGHMISIGLKDPSLVTAVIGLGEQSIIQKKAAA